MPRDIDMRKKFMEQFGYAPALAKPGKGKKPKKPKQTFKELVGARSIRMEIAYAAQDLRHIIIRYKKATTGEVKRYLVAPYSYRFRRTKAGSRQKALYAWDADDKKIKGFYVKNLKGIEPSAKTFKPKWAVELGS